jgi:hypothetical protein
MTSWENELYDEIFDAMLRYLTQRRGHDPEFAPSILKEMLSSEYKKQGDCWAGKSPVQDITEAATIAAFEHYLAHWDDAGGR